MTPRTSARPCTGPLSGPVHPARRFRRRALVVLMPTALAAATGDDPTRALCSPTGRWDRPAAAALLDQEVPVRLLRASQEDDLGGYPEGGSVIPAHAEPATARALSDAQSTAGRGVGAGRGHRPRPCVRPAHPFRPRRYRDRTPRRPLAVPYPCSACPSAEQALSPAGAPTPRAPSPPTPLPTGRIACGP